MKHGVAFRKFSRTSSHRMLMLRNLVTSLFEYEQIKTTLPKARDTARLAEKIITMGKQGDLPAWRRANAFVLKPAVLPKVFGTFAERYANRPGGYTRIHKFGNRPGDNAPHAILELVDNPRDLKFEMTARAVGWELVGKRLGKGGPRALAKTGVEGVEDVVVEERSLEPNERGELRQWTRWNLQKVLKFRKDDALVELVAKAKDHADTLIAKPLSIADVAKQEKEQEEQGDETPLPSLKFFRLKAGQTVPGALVAHCTSPKARLARNPQADHDGSKDGSLV